jgi:hypothetical protein
MTGTTCKVGGTLGLEGSANLAPNLQYPSRVVALDEAIRILNNAAALASTGSLVSWRIVDHARRHLESCISEEISDVFMADNASSATDRRGTVPILAGATTGYFVAL